jgi:hypothetical protein
MRATSMFTVYLSEGERYDLDVPQHAAKPGYKLRVHVVRAWCDLKDGVVTRQTLTASGHRYKKDGSLGERSDTADTTEGAMPEAVLTELLAAQGVLE